MSDTWKPGPLLRRGPAVMLADAVTGAAVYTLVLAIRFVDEARIPVTYAARMPPWAVLAALLHLCIGVGLVWVARRWPRSRRQPNAIFAAAALVALVVVLAINYLLLPLGLRLPAAVALASPLVATAGMAVVRHLGRRPPFQAEDLLQRRPVDLSSDVFAPAIRGKRIAITGAAGSIGAELSRQLLAVGPASVLTIDTNETGLYELVAELERPDGHAPVTAAIADVTDPSRLRALFQEHEPQVVFHAAAYKHVPLLEANPEQGFRTNVLGTLEVCRSAIAARAERVVVISTDKAVNPTSFMGLTKRTAELIVAALAESGPGTILSAVRFGNVLGSRGSLVPTLLRQIEAGDPLTITDPLARRYFMTLGESARLVLCSAATREPGALFVLDMGDDILVIDLARRLVRALGLEPEQDVPFVYTGLRAGEKLREELVSASETLEPTDQPYVRRIAPATVVQGEALLAGIEDLDRRRRSEDLQPADYGPTLRHLIENAVTPGEVAAAP